MTYKFKPVPKKPYVITLIGCGGTGGFIAHSLARIIYDLNIPHNITFIDGDRVEEKNVGRQNFYPAEVGKFKAEALAERYSIALGLNINYLNEYFENLHSQKPIIYQSDIIITAVDSAKSRKAIHQSLIEISNRRSQYLQRGYNIWVDTGNGNHEGQILIGNSFDKKIIKAQKPEKTVRFLPYPSLMEPDLINIKKDKENKRKKTLGCAERMQNREQSTTINSLIASITSSILYNLLTNKGISSCKIFVNETIPIVTAVEIKEVLMGENW